MVSIARDDGSGGHHKDGRRVHYDHILDQSGSIKTGGLAQTVTVGPINGYEVHNPNAVDDLWVADNGSDAAPNAAGSIRVAGNGGTYWTPEWWPPLLQRLSIYGATTGDTYTLRTW